MRTILDRYGQVFVLITIFLQINSILVIIYKKCYYIQEGKNYEETIK